jgi:Outer membrane protein Omp28
MKCNWSFLLCLVSLVSCDYVSESEVFPEKKPDVVTVIDTNISSGDDSQIIKDTLLSTDPNTRTSNRVAYIEYFTGHRCGNCPTKGADIAKSIAQAYSDKMVYISVHTGFFASFTATANKYNYNFQSSTGDAIESTFKIAAQGTPQGMVNRMVDQNSKAISPSNWANLVDRVTKETVAFKIGIIEGRILNGTLKLRYTLSFSESQAGLTTLAYLAEDELVNWQKDYTLTNQDVQNYVHHNVLRGQIGVTPVFDGASTVGKRVKFESVVNSNYNPNQLYVYILVLKDEEVLQVLRHKL